MSECMKIILFFAVIGPFSFSCFASYLGTPKDIAYVTGIAVTLMVVIASIGLHLIGMIK